MDSFNYSSTTLARSREVYKMLADRVTGLNLNPLRYGAVSNVLGFHVRAMRFPLAKIQDECRAKSWPTITVLIVDQATGKPNEGCDAYGDAAVNTVRRELTKVRWPQEAWW